VNDGRERRGSGTTNGTKRKLSSASYIVEAKYTWAKEKSRRTQSDPVNEKERSEQKDKNGQEGTKKAKGAQQRLASGPSIFNKLCQVFPFTVRNLFAISVPRSAGVFKDIKRSGRWQRSQTAMQTERT